MNFHRRNSLALRGFALFFTAYCVLASGRALIPGLCATLADLNQRNGESCCTPPPSCCETGNGEEGVTMAAYAPDHVCPFCTLVHTASQPAAIAAMSAPGIATPLQIAAHDGYVVDPTSVGCYLRRGPPSLA